MKQAIVLLCAVLSGGVALADSADSADSANSADSVDWPPALDSLREGDVCSERPACDENAAVDELSQRFAETARFVRVLSTTASDCSSVVALTDPRAKLGNVVTEPFGIGFRGSCVVNSDGAVIGSVHNGVIATCQRTPQPFGAVALETAIVELAPSGAGVAQVPVYGLPWFLIGQSECVIALDVQVQERDPNAPPPLAQAPVAPAPTEN